MLIKSKHNNIVPSDLQPIHNNQKRIVNSTIKKISSIKPSKKQNISTDKKIKGRIKTGNRQN